MEKAISDHNNDTQQHVLQIKKCSLRSKHTRWEEHRPIHNLWFSFLLCWTNHTSKKWTSSRNAELKFALFLLCRVMPGALPYQWCPSLPPAAFQSLPSLGPPPQGEAAALHKSKPQRWRSEMTSWRSPSIHMTLWVTRHYSTRPRMKVTRQGSCHWVKRSA